MENKVYMKEKTRKGTEEEEERSKSELDKRVHVGDKTENRKGGRENRRKRNRG